MSEKNLEKECLNVFADTYDRYCSQIDKEDELIDKRVNWLLTSQSILFAAVGLSGAGITKLFLPAVSLVGLFTALTIGVSVWAASRTLLWYQKKLIQICPPENDQNNIFPHLHREDKDLKIGLLPAKVVPFIFFFAWGVILVDALIT